MKLRKSALLTSFAILTIGSGCTTIEVAAPLPCPSRPILSPIPDDVQLRMGEDAVFIVSDNQLKLKAYAKKLEARASCEDR